jgi:hypothetical protein
MSLRGTEVVSHGMGDGFYQLIPEATDLAWSKEAISLICLVGFQQN